MRRLLAPAFVLLLSLTACGGSSSPTEPSGSGGTSTVLQGQTVNAIDGSPVANLSVRIGTNWPVTSDGSGLFQVDTGSLGTYRAIVSGGSVVERETRMSPTGSRTRVSMIPTTFDLTAFNEMFRSTAQLQRWTARPSLVILASVMDYRANASGQTHDATADQLTDDEVTQLKAHLTEGLAFLTGGTFTGFASVEVERPAPGAHVNTLRSGQIVVGRYNGIVTLVRTIGYGMWSELPDGSIGGGSIYLDREFDRADNRRRLLRIHELGHALGYQHVESRVSIMNPAIGPEPTEFDRAGAIIAFARPVGNKSPDVDPATAALSMSTGEGRWVGPRTVCAVPNQ